MLLLYAPGRRWSRKANEAMGEVDTGLSISLGGFIAGPNDGPHSPLGEGGERLFAWYSVGNTEYRLPDTEVVFNVSPQSADLLREAHTKMRPFTPRCATCGSAST
jgi:hypothetical protein